MTWTNPASDDLAAYEPEDIGHDPSMCGPDCIEHGIVATEARSSAFFARQNGSAR
ncbi:hypothetical protein [Agromyces aureus]|uniref:hypothetical protein n=1 Tax=Agromyces aureus TaxID=453304 RepID=UPI000B0F52B6|nr:hypothetical protein [Agromyces aureus]